MDAIEMALQEMRLKGEAEEAKHDCKGCTRRVGIPCLIAKSCDRIKEGSKHETNT